MILVIILASACFYWSGYLHGRRDEHRADLKRRLESDARNADFAQWQKEAESKE